MDSVIKIDSKDNVVVALQNIKKETFIKQHDLHVLEDVKFGHKIALYDIKQGDTILKYGYAIAQATCDIAKGETVHTHNIKTTLSSDCEYTYNPTLRQNTDFKTGTINGFRRNNSKVGVRNEIWIIPTVGCVNSVAMAIATEANKFISGTVERVIAYTHPYGCSQMGDDQENTKKILADLANHPNAGGVLLLGLGCENCGVDTIKPYLGNYDKNSIKFIVAQEVEDEIECSVKIVKELIANAGATKREKCGIDELVIGLKCGGSDGLSGITANPTIGVFSDKIISYGATTILTEVPEMFGAETILFDRCKDEETFYKAVKLINDFKYYFTSHDQVVYENPSPGNKDGGISTLEDKSLGCTQKSGTANVVDVLGYGESVKTNGLNLLYSPGNDLVAATALAASGAQIVLFTTGRGTPFASPVPTLKISSNSELAQTKRGWIDFDCGKLTQGGTVDDTAQELFDKVIEVANGELVRSEKNGYYDMAIFKQGVTL